MKDRQRVALIALVLLASLVAGLIIAACQAPPTPTEEPSRAGGSVQVVKSLRVVNDATVGGNLTVSGTSSLSGGVSWDWPQSVNAPTAVATATPAFYVNNPGAANNAFEVRDASTPVFVVGQAGVGSITGALTMSGGYTANNAAYVNAPTAVATATPALMVNSAGVSNLFEARANATPVFSVSNGGAIAVTGASTLTGGYVSSASSQVTGPTAVATATPAFFVDNLGAGNVALEVRDAATPVFKVANGGAVYSYVPVSAKDGNYTVTVADTGLTIKSSGSITMTLPGAVAGLQYCIVNYDGGDLTIDFTDATDVALNEVNSPGDRVTNTTQYDSICLQAIDTTNWVTLSSLGTWSDGN